MVRWNRHYKVLGLAIVLMGAIAACQTQQQIVAEREDNLAAAGFMVRPANTPERQAMLNRLPLTNLIEPRAWLSAPVRRRSC